MAILLTLIIIDVLTVRPAWQVVMKENGAVNFMEMVLHPPLEHLVLLKELLATPILIVLSDSLVQDLRIVVLCVMQVVGKIQELIQALVFVKH